MKDLSNWKPCQRPQRKTFEGRFVRLEPLDAQKHGDDLFQVFTEPDSEKRMTYVFDFPETRENFQKTLEKYEILEDRLYFAAIDKASGKAIGRQAFMEIDPENGCCELGRIYRSRNYSRCPGSTEVIYLFLCHLFDDLGYRRVAWRCHNENNDSRRTALRLGFTFEGVFRQAVVIKGFNQDTANGNGNQGKLRLRNGCIRIILMKMVYRN